MVQVTDDGVDLSSSSGDGEAHGLMSRVKTDAAELGNGLDLLIRVWGREESSESGMTPMFLTCIQSIDGRVISSA